MSPVFCLHVPCVRKQGGDSEHEDACPDEAAPDVILRLLSFGEVPDSRRPHTSTPASHV